LDEALTAARTFFGDDHRDTARCLVARAQLHAAVGNGDQARALASEALAVMDRRGLVAEPTARAARSLVRSR
jgi:hypothetical protein